MSKVKCRVTHPGPRLYFTIGAFGGFVWEEAFNQSGGAQGLLLYLLLVELEESYRILELNQGMHAMQFYYSCAIYLTGLQTPLRDQNKTGESLIADPNSEVCDAEAQPSSLHCTGSGYDNGLCSKTIHWPVNPVRSWTLLESLPTTEPKAGWAASFP